MKVGILNPSKCSSYSALEDYPRAHFKYFWRLVFWGFIRMIDSLFELEVKSGDYYLYLMLVPTRSQNCVYSCVWLNVLTKNCSATSDQYLTPRIKVSHHGSLFGAHCLTQLYKHQVEPLNNQKWDLSRIYFAGSGSTSYCHHLRLLL